MKVLCVYNFVYPDYQADTVYRGLVDSGHEVYETYYPRYMLSGFEFKKESIYRDVSNYIYDGIPNTTFTI
jgi:hypothetical protein